MNPADSLIVLLMLIALFWTFSLHSIRPEMAKQETRYRVTAVLIEGVGWFAIWVAGQMVLEQLSFEESLPRALIAAVAWMGIAYYVRAHYHRLARQKLDSLQ